METSTGTVQPLGRPTEDEAAAFMMSLAEELFPICRSITGNGVRQSLAIIGRHIPLKVTEVPSGTPVLDWTVPREWNIREAYIAKLDGTRVVDFAQNNLHIVQYSTPINAVVPLQELRRHLHTLPDRPRWIPYRTSYYKETWGFCLTHKQFESLTDDTYRVVIDTSLTPGYLTYAECIIPGATEKEILLSCHICHPSLANDNLSAMVVATILARHLQKSQLRHTYRFVFIPGTIGAITWLARHDTRMPPISHGLVLSCLGDAGAMTYKKSREGNTAIDRIVTHILRDDSALHRIFPFVPYGYDERQYCSPGFNLPVGCLMRTLHGEYPEYHSSADNLSLLHAKSLVHSVEILRRIIYVIENDATYLSRNPKGEPQLGRHGLYDTIGGRQSTRRDQMALLWVLNLADGQHSLLDTAERAGLPFLSIRAAADALLDAGLLDLVG